MNLTKDTNGENSTPDVEYKICAVMVRDASDYKKLDKKVNDLMAQGYELAGNIAVDHCGNDHADAVQPMIRRNKASQ